MDPSIYAALISVGVLGFIFGGGLAYASKKFHVEIDPRAERVLDALPGINCGACGYPGCSAFAEGVVNGEAEPSGCTPGGEGVSEIVSAIMGVEVVTATAPVAVVQCKGGRGEAKQHFQYYGVPDCNAADLVAGGHMACRYGCLGLGSCVRACPFDAMEMNDNDLPVVYDDLCTGCGLCVAACPRNIIALIPREAKVYLGCVSRDRGKKVKDVCSVGCTGCTLCANPKVTPSGAIQMDGYLPVIDFNVEDNLLVAAYKCPTNSFVDKLKHRPKFTITNDCTGTGECVSACPVKDCITGVKGEKFEINPELCISCGRCQPVCPEKAITVIGALAYQEQSLEGVG
ncbi:RnfABCDGE type electron transport complex subunit B [candidate division KSB1 bacterium]|nr:RnfABCDGE type electron transport complex subunit B [candidate division KSB1 bacterium]